MQKFTFSKKILERPKQNCSMLGILLCEWWEKAEWTCHPVMRCILCYVDLVNGFNPRTKERKGLITYHKTYVITTLKKHVNAYHSIIAKKFEEEINNRIIENAEKQPAKKRPNVPRSVISIFFIIKEPFKKDDL